MDLSPVFSKGFYESLILFFQLQSPVYPSKVRHSYIRSVGILVFYKSKSTAAIKQKEQTEIKKQKCESVIVGENYKTNYEKTNTPPPLEPPKYWRCCQIKSEISQSYQVITQSYQSK